LAAILKMADISKILKTQNCRIIIIIIIIIIRNGAKTISLPNFGTLNNKSNTAIIIKFNQGFI
jgi:hypothetical protein